MAYMEKARRDVTTKAAPALNNTDWRRVRRELHRRSPARRAQSVSLTAWLAQLAFVLGAAAFFAVIAALAQAGQFEIWLAAITSVLVSVALLTLGQAKPLSQRLVLAASWTFVIGLTLASVRLAQSTGLTG